MRITIYVLNLEFHLTFFTFLVFWRYLQLVFGLPISVIRLQFVELDFLIVLECCHFFSFVKIENKSQWHFAGRHCYQEILFG